MVPLVCGRWKIVCFADTRSILTLVSIIRLRGAAAVKMYKYDTAAYNLLLFMILGLINSMFLLRL